jgi:hypothetical protein
MRPLIDYMKYSRDVNNPIKSVDIFLRDTLEIFFFHEKFRTTELIPVVPWVGLESSQLFTELNKSMMVNKCRRASIDFFPPIPTYFQQIYSTVKKFPFKYLSLDVDIRFKPLFCLWKAVDGEIFVIFLSWAQRPSVNAKHSFGKNISNSKVFSLNNCEKEVNCVSDLFPIQFSCNEVDYRINNPSPENDLLELYEVYSSMYSVATPKSPYTLTASGKSISTEDSAISSNPNPVLEKIEELYSLLKQAEKEIRIIDDQLKNHNQRFQEEVNFLSKYFHSCWKVENEIGEAKNDELLKEVISCRDILDERRTNITEKKRQASDAMGVSTAEDSLDPIVYFNVEGEIFTILRSTILKVIPKSQLAVRVSGRWEEQPSKGDIDEERNLIVNCHKESFKQILSALQICASSADNLFVVYVNLICKDYIEETLDYLQIVPDLIATIEKSF